MFQNRIQPENLTKEYIVSRQQCTIKHLKWPPLYHPTTTKEKLRRELTATEDYLKKKRQYFRDQRKVMDAQWQKLSDDEESLRASFLEFDKFIRDNAGKKTRAERKIKDDGEFYHKLLNDTKELAAKIEQLKENKVDMDRNIQSHKIYQNFLDKVLEIAAEDSYHFKNRNGILQTYVEQSEMRQSLAEKQDNALTLLENAKQQVLELMEVHHDRIVGFSNRLGDLNERYEDMVQECRYWEKTVEQVKGKMLERRSEMDSTLDSIHQTYRDMCYMKRSPYSRNTNVEDKLTFIKNTLGQLKVIRTKVLAIVAKQQQKQKKINRPS